MLAPEEAWRILEEAELVCSAARIAEALQRMAESITERLGQAHPLVLSVMGGSVVFSGHLLPLLHFPLDFDYLHVTRYGGRTRGEAVRWKVTPGENVSGRVVLALDDILDEGHTLAAIRDWVLSHGASAFYSAVLTDKAIGRDKPVRPDWVGITVPDRYVFGFGMDVRGAWRNLPAIYAVREPPQDAASRV
jgi:hypoxanthine phosphoribosyltransferase